MYNPYSIGSSNIFGNNNILMDQQTTKAIIEKYTARPRSFSEKQVNIIKRHAQHYRIPFAEDEQTWMDHVGGVVKQAVQGYISGFTTINIGEAPQTPAESVSRAVGSLAGFIGLTPATPLKMLGAATKSQSLINAGTAMAKARGNSVPLYIANKILKKGTAVFDATVAKQTIDGTGAVASAIKFLKNPQTSDYISRGLRMGIASGISSWQGGIDQMMKSFLWGASAGTIDATIANAIRMDSKVSEGVIKGFAGALSDGLPATLRGDTTPEQVYYYLRGAYFGATEVPWSKRYANEKILEYKKGGVDRDTFIKGLPKAVRKDFIEGISRIDLTPMTETALKEAGLWGKFNEEHKRYVNLEVTKYITDTDDNKATSDNGGDPGQGPIDLHIPPTIRIKNIVESFPDIWRTDGGDNVEAKRRFTDDIMIKHQKTIDEFKSEYNTDPNYYHDKMIEELRSAGYMEDKVPEQVSLELHAIARDAENTKYSKYFVPTIDFEEGTFEISISDAIHNRAPNNKILGERYHSNLLDDIIGEFSGGKDTVIRLPNIYVQGTRGYEEVPISSAKNPDSREIAFNSNLRDEHKTKLVETANNIDREIYNKYGYVYFGGNNAKIDALYVPFHPEIAAIRNNPQAIDTAFNTLMTNMFESKTMRNASGEEFKSVDDLKKYVLDGLSKSNVMGLDLEKAIYTSHALYEMRMQFGGTKLADTADYYKNFFDDAKLPKDVKAMTKRMQLVMAAGTPLREPYFRDVDRTKLNPLFNDLKTPRILLVKDAGLTDADFRIGVDLPGSAERSTDGSVFVLPELMKIEGEYTGLGKEIGAIKSVGVAATGTGGTILAKHAEHVAPPALAKIMRENGVTHVMMGTAGKVTGSYNQRMITMDELMAAKFENLQSKVISETRWEDWKVNTGKALTPRKAHKAKFRVPIQSLSMLNGRYGALDGDEVDTVRQIFVDEVIRKNFYGEQASNDKVTEFLNADGKTALKLRQEILNDEILDGIGRQNIMKLILDDRDVSIADKLITRIINENMDSINEKYQDGEMSSMEYESAMREASADSGILSKALYASESATSLLYNPQTRGIVDKVINNYIVGAAIRPKISNGMELPIAPYFAKAWGNDPVMKLLNVPVDPTGTIKDADGNPVQKVYKFALGNSERYKKITRADGKKELLGDIYDRVMQRRKDPEYLSRLSETEKEQALEDVELLRWVIIRTPHSHPSSTIVAELAGFDGMDGPRIYLDQAAMGRLGGADVDIDTVKIFTGSKISEDGKFHGMPARLKDAFNQFEHLAYKIETVQQQTSGQVATDEKAVRLVEAKSDVDDMGNRISTQYERFAQVENDPLYSPAMMYARGTRQQIQQMFVTGRNDLGEIANAGGSHMSEAVSFLKQQPDETYKTTINYGGKKATIVYKLREDMMMLALKKYNTALNMAADVTDFNGLKDPADIKYDIFNHAFDIKVTIDGKPASDKDRKTIILTRGLMKKIASAKQAMYSRNYRANRRFTADEIYSILKDAEDIYGGRTDTLIGAARQAILDADMSIPLITKDNADVVRKVYDRYKELILTQRYAHKMARPSSAVVQTEDVKLFFQNKMWDPAYREQVIDTYSQKAWTDKTIEIVLRQNGVVRRTKSVDGDTYKSSYVLTVEGNLQKMIAAANRKKNKTAEKEIGTVLGKYINKKNGRKVTFTDADKRILDSAETMMRRDLADIDKLGLQKDRLWRTRFMQEQYRRSERYIANDLYDMVSTMMEHKYINQIPEDLQSQIPHKIGRSIHMLHQKMDEIRNLPGVQRVGEHSIDELHNELRKGLTPEEQKLFDTELFSSMLWGGKGQQDGSKRGVSKSEVTNLGYSLANPPNDIIREYNESILGVLKGKQDIVEVGYEKSPLAKNDGTAEDIMMQVIKNPDMLRTPGGIVDTTSWDNMTAMDLVNKVIPYEVDGDAKSAVLKDPILKKIYYKEMLPEMQELKKHFIDRKITDANDILNLVRGMTGRGVDQNRVGKDPTALTLEEVKMLNRAFRYIEEPQLLVKIFGGKSVNYPIIRKLYYYLIPSEIGRDIQRFVWDTKKTQGFWANKYGKAFVGSVEVPTNVIESISEYINMAQSLATKAREDMVRKVGDDMKRYMDHPMFPELFDIAVIKREHASLVESIKGQVDMPKDTKLRHLEELDSLYKTANRKLRNIQKLHPDMQVKFSGADGSDIIVNLSPKQIIDNINEVITKNLSDIYDNLISAKMENVNKYAKRFTDGPQKGKIIYIRNPKTNNLTTIPVIDKRAFFADMEKATIEKGGWDMGIGIDGARMIAHSILYQSQYGGVMNKINADEANAFLKLADNNAMTTLKWTQEGYFPHMHSDRARFARDINDYIKDVENDKSMSSDAKKKNIEKYVRNYVRNGANINSEVDVDYLHRYGDIIDSEMKRQDRINKSSDSKLKYLNGISRSGNQMHREYFSLGYSRNIDALYEYMGNMSSVYYRNISQILSRIKIADFTNELAKQYDKKTANNLRNFMHLYAQGAAGYGVTIPEFLVDNPDMKIKGTLYHMYSDSVITDKINKISTKLGIKGGMAGKFSQHDLAAWSALEAKYSLATLLSRPKSMTGNIIGGTLNTLISTGFSPLARAQNLVELRKAHPEFVTMEDWHKWAVQKGVVEDMFLNELEGGRYAGHVGMKGAITQIVKKLANDPNMDDKTLMQIAKQSGVSEELFKKAGWFMRTAERKLRLDSFFAHYLQQFDNLSPYVGGNDAHSSLKFDSPILIEMAKKGIKATQFLYSAPFRPMFSTSSVGKIMTRFQMYAYNSIDFRKNIVNMAGIYGFQEGTNEFERMRRLIIADMVSLAAANAFMYSVFDNNLPAPWTWVQDLANWLFGNERERDRAFYGSYPSAIAPLQIVTPPSMRLVGPTIKGMIDNDFSKISGYTIWTMFPFGPLGMDIKRSLENPMQIMDTMLGLPLRGAANVAKTGVNSKIGETWTKEKKTKEETEVEEKPKKPKINNAFMQMVPVY